MTTTTKRQKTAENPMWTDTLPKRTARRRKVHQAALHANPGKWGRLQTVSESGNAAQYKKTYGPDYDFAIRRDENLTRWLWGRYTPPVKPQGVNYATATQSEGEYVHGV